ncbi:uncharacterized protein V6R79_011477 [Siganus canaliculatus]
MHSESPSAAASTQGAASSETISNQRIEGEERGWGMKVSAEIIDATKWIDLNVPITAATPDLMHEEMSLSKALAPESPGFCGLNFPF